jgi:hypothetical protein
MPVTYLDQNALIGLGRKARHADFRKKLDRVLESKALVAVVSSWHLIETAHTPKLRNAIELAEFIDSLKPSWLLERHDIQRLDVEEDFFKFLRLAYSVRPRVTTRSAAFAALNKQEDSSKFDIASRDFVKQWIEHPEHLKVLEEAYKKNEETLPRLREFTKQGKMTDEFRRRVDELLVTISLPKCTPAGLVVGREAKAEYIQQMNIASISSIAVETAISEHEWVSKEGTDRNTLIDKFHLISALPHVDEIISNDKFFHEMYPLAQKTGFVKAKLLGNDEFLSRF